MLPQNYRNVLSYLIWGGHFWHPIWIFATFCIPPALWRFSPKSPISLQSPFSPKLPVTKGPGGFSPLSPALWRFSPKSPISKGPLLVSNSSRQRLAIDRHFRHCMHFWIKDPKLFTKLVVGIVMIFTLVKLSDGSIIGRLNTSSP